MSSANYSAARTLEMTNESLESGASVDTMTAQQMAEEMGGHAIGEDTVVFHVENDPMGLRDKNMEINVYGRDAKPWKYNEPQLFSEYKRMFLESMLVNTLVRFLTDEIGGERYYFEGPEDKVEQVEDFFYDNDVREQLDQVVEQSILLGTGVGAMDPDNEFREYRRVDTETIDIDRDETTGEETIIQRVPDGEDIDLTENGALLRFFEYPDSEWGISLLRAALVGIQGIEDLFRDIPPAIKQLAYVDRVMKLDMEGIEDPDERQSILDSSRDAFSEYDAASTTVVVMDKDNEMGYMGSIGGGGGGARIKEIIPVIEPILMFVLLNFNIAPGEVLQDGVNRATLQQQSKLATKRINNLRGTFARFVEKNIVREILGEDGRPSVTIKYKPEPLSPEDEARHMLAELQAGVLTVEEYRSKRGLKPEIDGTLIQEVVQEFDSPDEPEEPDDDLGPTIEDGSDE